MKTSTITRTTSAPAADVERYCRGLGDWPRSWMGLEKDVPPGQRLVTCFRPFIEYLVTSSDIPEDHSETH
jgi:hypothetical protein